MLLVIARHMWRGSVMIRKFGIFHWDSVKEGVSFRTEPVPGSLVSTRLEASENSPLLSSRCVLAVIIVVNLRGALRKFTDIPRMWRVNRIDAAVWLVTMATSALVNTELGLLVGVMASALCVLSRTQRAQVLELGRTPTKEHYEALAAYRGLQTHPGVVVFRYAAPIYYANQSLFKRSLYRRAGLDPVQEKAQRLKFEKKNKAPADVAGAPNVSLKEAAGVDDEGGAAVTLMTPPRSFHSLVIDCSSVPFVDTAGVTALKEVRKDYEAVGIKVVLAQCNPSVLDDLQRGGFFPDQSTHAAAAGTLVFFCIADAVHHVQRCSVSNGDYESKC